MSSYDALERSAKNMIKEKKAWVMLLTVQSSDTVSINKK